MFLSGVFSVGIMVGIATMQLRVCMEIIFLGSVEMIQKTILIPFSMSIAAAICAFYFFKRTNRKHNE